MGASPLREWSGEVSCNSTFDDEGRRCAGEFPTLRPATQWVKPGLIGRVKHLRGEEDLRHASLQDFWDND